ncbi:MAG: response regulator [Woeseiaceae bacterium]
MYIDRDNLAASTLLISDCEFCIEKTRNLLTNMGLNVHVAETSGDAHLFCLTRKPRFVIADLEMADGDGFEAMSLVRSTHRTTRVIAVTRGDHDVTWLDIVFGLGAHAYVVGPLTFEKLQEALFSHDVGRSYH